MTHRKHDSATFHMRMKLLVVAFLLALLATPLHAQNTKGDDSAPKASRETRFKTKPSKKEAKPKNKRITPSGRTPVSSAARGPQERERVWSGDISGRKVPATRKSRTSQRNQNVYQTQRRSSSGGPVSGDDARVSGGGQRTGRLQPSPSSAQARNVYARSAPYARKPKQPTGGDRPYKSQMGASAQPKIRSSSDRARNVYPKKGRYAAKSRPPSQDDQSATWQEGRFSKNRQVRSVSGGTENVFRARNAGVAKNKPPSAGDKPRRWGQAYYQTRVRSATGTVKNTFPARGPFVAKTRPPSKGDQPDRWSGTYNRKPTVRSATERTKNTYSAKGPYVNNPSKKPRAKETPGTKLARKAPMSASRPYLRKTSINPNAGFWNIRRSGEQAHVGDIAGKPIRGRNYRSTPQSIQGNAGSAYSYYLKSRPSGESSIGRTGRRNLSATRDSKAWQGDISGRNLRYRNFTSRKTEQAGMLPAGLSIRRTKPADHRQGPQSIPNVATASGRSWNNNGKPVNGKPPKSLSGQLWNNQQTPISGRGPRGSAFAAASFQSSSKARKPEQGGGSISGQLWNNKGNPVTGKSPKGVAFSAAAYQGTIKTRRPEQGGGSVSGQLWNNKGNAISGKQPKGSAMVAANYSGSMKAGQKEPGKEINGFPGKYTGTKPVMRKQGEDFTGHLKRPFIRKDYVRNDNAAEAAMKKQRPSKTSFNLEQLRVKVKEADYTARNHTPKSTMPGIAPDKNAKKASEFDKGLKQDWKYIHNPSSAKLAVDVRNPGKAFGSISDYQGNVNMKKQSTVSKKDLHPDARFVKTNKNNVKEERDAATNFKLFWARLFGKSDTQPSSLKEPVRKPRYDKREIGMWYD